MRAKSLLASLCVGLLLAACAHKQHPTRGCKNYKPICLLKDKTEKVCETGADGCQYCTCVMPGTRDPTQPGNERPRK